MIGKLKLDTAGIDALASTLTAHGSSIALNASAADNALLAAQGAISSKELSSAVSGFVSRLAGHAAQLSEPLSALSTTGPSAAASVAQTDVELAAAVPNGAVR